MTNIYRIEDEPQPTKLSHLVVNPFWPFSSVIWGTWVGWPWLVINGFIMGSPTRWRELSWIIGGFMGSIVLAIILVLHNNGSLQSRSGLQYIDLDPYFLLLFWRLIISCIVVALQIRTFGLYEYYGGIVKNGVWVFLGALFGHKIVLNMLPSDFWFLVMH